jgi:hypothetical protein
MEWKNYEDVYYANRNGDIKSLKYNKERILKQQKTGTKGHYRSVNVNGKLTLVHIIIAKLFCNNPYKYNEINHKNGIPWDNNYVNLEYCSHKENIQHYHKNGFTHQYGETHTISKLKNYQVDEIRKKYIPRKYSQRKLSKEYNVSQSTIHDIVNNKSYLR